jgi:class 3 adenylate cyclase
MTDYRINSLEDFLISKPLTIDRIAEDGWGAPFPIKGREIQGTILFADISNFSGRTSSLSSTETLAFVNHFFSWVTAEAALTSTRGIVDKYIGDEIMMVFSYEFGSEDPFGEAVTVARRFGDNDVFGFWPHIGIASGPVTVGYVGTHAKYNCSVFGSPVALAARCAAVRAREKVIEGVSFSMGASIAFPAAEWDGRTFANLFPPKRYNHPHGDFPANPTNWKIHPPRVVSPKNMTPLEVVCVENTAIWIPSEGARSAEQWAQDHVGALKPASA